MSWTRDKYYVEMASYLMDSKRCVLHLNENNTQSEIHFFTEETLEMCKEVQLV